MATGKIVKRTVDAQHPGAKDQFFWDDKLEGFGLKVTPADSKVYLIQYPRGARDAKTRRCTIGAQGPWTPAAARDEAERLIRLVRQGLDPADDRERRQRDENLAFGTMRQVPQGICSAGVWRHRSNVQIGEINLERAPPLSF